MTIKLEDFITTLSMLKRKDSGAKLAYRGNSLVVLSSKDAVTGESILDFDCFKESLQDKLLASGILYNGMEKEFYYNLYDLKMPLTSSNTEELALV